jgi:carbonic anhydrase
VEVKNVQTTVAITRIDAVESYSKVEHVMVVRHYGCGGVQAVAEKR